MALTERNRVIISQVAKALFIDRDVDRFAEHVSDEEYIQHNPLIPNGKAAVIAFLRVIAAANTATAELKHIVVDGDIGVVHAQFTDGSGQPPQTIVDMFRIRDGKLVEHWDVMNLKIEQYLSKIG